MRDQECTLEGDKDIRNILPSLDDQLTPDQVKFIGSSLERLRTQVENWDRRSRPRDWPEWHAMIDACYACGFVTRDDDGKAGGKILRSIEVDPEEARHLSLRQLRQLFHFIIRSERWGDAGAATGGGTLWAFLTQRASVQVERLLKTA